MCVYMLAQRVLRDYRKVERRLLARVAEKDAALEAAAAERLNGGLLGRKQVRSAVFTCTMLTLCFYARLIIVWWYCCFAVCCQEPSFLSVTQQAALQLRRCGARCRWSAWRSSGRASRSWRRSWPGCARSSCSRCKSYIPLLLLRMRALLLVMPWRLQDRALRSPFNPRCN